MERSSILSKVKQYYAQKLAEHGPNPRGVDWNSAPSQVLRFQQILRVCEGRRTFSLNDYGCGYGALAAYLIKQNCRIAYSGFDVAESMIAAAKTLFRDYPQCVFSSSERDLSPADFTLASGIFNVKLNIETPTWEQYIFDTLHKINGLSHRGFAFNMLTSYSDPERMRPDLYYANPATVFDYCKQQFSPYVALLHDYPLYEFTVLVRK